MIQPFRQNFKPRRARICALRAILDFAAPSVYNISEFIGGLTMFKYKTRGTCSQMILIDADADTIKHVEFIGG